MSHHVIEDLKLRWVFGWDQKYRSFYIMKHVKELPENQNPVVNLGSRPREVPDADDLFRLASMIGLDIPYEFRLTLYRDKDHEQKDYFVLHFVSKFAAGFRTDSLAHAELLKEEIEKASPNEELQIRQITEYS